MIVLRKSDQRGHTKLPWLDSRHTFSFADYRDPAYINFGPLRVMNEDWIAPASGFPTHGHQDMEIVTYIISGALSHRDSLGTGSTIEAGEIQRMSAGTGIQHSEFNASRDTPVHLLQIWFLPAHQRTTPSYEQKRFEPGKNALQTVVVPRTHAAKTPHAVSVDQDLTLYAGHFDAGASTQHILAPGRRAWVQLVAGALEVNGVTLAAGDGAALTEEATLSLKATASSEVLVFDLP